MYIIIIIIIIAWRRGWLVRSRRGLCDEYLHLSEKKFVNYACMYT